MCSGEQLHVAVRHPLALEHAPHSDHRMRHRDPVQPGLVGPPMPSSLSGKGRRASRCLTVRQGRFLPASRPAGSARAGTAARAVRRAAAIRSACGLKLAIRRPAESDLRSRHGSPGPTPQRGQRTDSVCLSSMDTPTRTCTLQAPPTAAWPPSTPIPLPGRPRDVAKRNPITALSARQVSPPPRRPHPEPQSAGSGPRPDRRQRHVGEELLEPVELITAAGNSGKHPCSGHSTSVGVEPVGGLGGVSGQVWRAMVPETGSIPPDRGGERPGRP